MQNQPNRKLYIQVQYEFKSNANPYECQLGLVEYEHAMSHTYVGVDKRNCLR